MFKKPTFTQFYAIFSLINVQKYFAWLSFRSFPATMAIFSQIGDGPVTPKGDSLMHPLLILTGVLRCHIMSFIHLDDFLRVRNHLSQTEPFYRIFSQLWACLPSIAFSPPHQYEISHFMNYHNPICLEIALITKQKVALILTKFVLKSLSWWKIMLRKS